MSTPSGKKAVHVKWAGKTIALGTFPITEADDKCARAKALTRAWRSTMRPKPSRDWVMLELERLNVRVVSGRLGAKENEGSDGSDNEESSPVNGANSGVVPNQVQGGRMGGSGTGVGRRNSVTAPLLNMADITRAAGERRNSLAGLDPNILFNQQLRNNSLNLSSLLGGDAPNGPGSINGTGGNHDKRSNSPRHDEAAPPHRPLVGGGSAAAYEAARADHYSKLAEKKNTQNGRGGVGNGAGGNKSLSIPGSNNMMGDLMGQGGNLQNTPSGLPPNANQHYEMLKLHHMNLLNEIQETTLMMNLYQQQQLHQQQQQQQQQIGQNRMEPQMLLAQQQQQMLEQSHGTNGRHGSGRGSSEPRGGGNEERGDMANVIAEHNGSNSNINAGSRKRTNGEVSTNNNMNSQRGSSPSEESSSTSAERLQKIKDEIAERQRIVEELEKQQQGGSSSGSGNKSKRHKVEGAEEQAEI
jgi:hypothetical protein